MLMYVPYAVNIIFIIILLFIYQRMLVAIKANNRFKSAIDLIDSPIILTNGAGRCFFSNAVARDLFQLKEGDNISKLKSQYKQENVETASGNVATQIEYAGKKYRLFGASLVEQNGNNIGHMDMYIEKTFIHESKEEDVIFIDGVSQAIRSFIDEAKSLGADAAELAGNSANEASEIISLSNSINDISEKTQANTALSGKASSLADSIMENAEKGTEEMGSLTQAVKDINDFIQSISKVFKFIDDIAFQTNILALNAAVEAARAGQHGKGFAVVADEVRNLAAKSAASAKDTGEIISDSLEKARIGMQIADETAASFQEIVSGINESRKIAKEILALSEEQNSKITNVNSIINVVADSTQKSSSMAKGFANVSTGMNDNIERIHELVDTYQQSLVSFYDHFINEA